MTTTINSPQGKGQSTTEKAKSAASTASENIKAGAQSMADTVSTEASNYASQAKESAADEVNDVASALRKAADDLRSGSPQERTLSQIANGLADASEAVRDKDLSEIVSDLNGYAKRNPLVFLGSAALIGFAATRFAKASGNGQTTDTGSYAGSRGGTGAGYRSTASYAGSTPPASPVTSASPVTGEKS